MQDTLQAEVEELNAKDDQKSSRSTESQRTELRCWLSDTEECLLASPTRHHTGRRMPPSSQGPFLEDKTLSCRAETSSLSRPPLSSALPRTDAREVATKELDSGETPSQQAPKATSEDSQDLHLVKPSPEDVSSEPHRSDANPPPGTNHARTSSRMSRVSTTIAELELKVNKFSEALDTLPPGQLRVRSMLEEDIAKFREKLLRARRKAAKKRSK